MDIIEYALQLARPSFCEVQLSRFLAAVRMDCKSRQDVDALYKEWRRPKEKDRRPRIIRADK